MNLCLEKVCVTVYIKKELALSNHTSHNYEGTHMSVSSKAIMAALRISSLFNPLDADTDAILEKARKYNAKQHFELPRNGKIEYEDMTVCTRDGTYHCLRMRKRGSMPMRAVLYIAGGGGVYDYCRMQMFLPRTLLKHVDAEVFYPFYPPTTGVSLAENYAMIIECYKAMLDEYPPEKCAVVGVSYGATVAMSMITWNNVYGEGLTMPELTIALSPGHVPANEKEQAMLEVYRGIDPMVPVDFVVSYGKINGRGRDVADWMLHTAHGDFRNAGKIMLYWGAKESLAFSEPIYRESLDKAGADYQIHIEPGMPHTYASMRVNKACRDSYDEYARTINSL